jgi:hypothetical protein
MTTFGTAFYESYLSSGGLFSLSRDYLEERDGEREVLLFGWGKVRRPTSPPPAEVVI